MRQDRAKFSASIAIRRLTLRYLDSHTKEFLGEEAKTIALKLPDRPTALSAIDLINADHKDRGVTALTRGGDEALAIAAKFGTATVEVNFDSTFAKDYVMEFSKVDPHDVMVGVKVEYTIVLKRLADG
jgi:hypothetical protein